MPKRVTIQPYLNVDELQNRYRGCQDPVERSHYQIIWLLAQGKSTQLVAAVTGYSRDEGKSYLKRAAALNQATVGS